MSKQRDEVAYFIEVLKKMSSLGGPQLELIRQRFLKIKGQLDNRCEKRKAIL